MVDDTSPWVIDDLKKKIEQLEHQLFYLEYRIERYEKTSIYTKIKTYISSYIWSVSHPLETEMLGIYSCSDSSSGYDVVDNENDRVCNKIHSKEV